METQIIWNDVIMGCSTISFGLDIGIKSYQRIKLFAMYDHSSFYCACLQ